MGLSSVPLPLLWMGETDGGVAVEILPTQCKAYFLDALCLQGHLACFQVPAGAQRCLHSFLLPCHCEGFGKVRSEWECRRTPQSMGSSPGFDMPACPMSSYSTAPAFGSWKLAGTVRCRCRSLGRCCHGFRCLSGLARPCFNCILGFGCAFAAAHRSGDE